MKLMSLLLLVLTLSGCSTIKRQIELAGQREAKFKVDMKSAKIPVGTVETQLDRTFLGLKKTNVIVTYSPHEDAVCLEFKRNTVTNYQFWNRPARTAFLQALESYEKDFDERKLVKGKGTAEKYGSSEGYLVWKLTKLSTQYNANMDIDLGYSFKDRSPFFSVRQGEAVFEDIFADTSEKYSTNGEFLMFFTRAQAAELAAFFDQQFLRNLTTVRDPSLIDPNVRYEAY